MFICVYVCMYVYICIYIYIYVHMYIHMYTVYYIHTSCSGVISTLSRSPRRRVTDAWPVHMMVPVVYVLCNATYMYMCVYIYTCIYMLTIMMSL